MSEPEKRKYDLPAAKKVLLRLMVAVLGILLCTFLSLKIYLSTALPAAQLSRYLTSYLQQGFTVASLDTSGRTLVLRGVRLENPAGFPGGVLAAADSVAIAPQWINLVLGRQGFRLIALEGLKVKLDKNSSGVWNFVHLQRFFAAKKPSGVETYIGELLVKEGSFQVQGRGLQGIALQIFNLTSKGSRDSRVDLAFEDAAHNRYALKGGLRAGTDAALDLVLAAPSLSLKNAAVALKLKNPELFEGGKGALRVSARLHKGELTTSGDLSFSGLRMTVAEKTLPISGMLRFAADYSLKNDTARLQAGSLTIDDLVNLQAKGSASDFQRERDFALEVGMDELDLSKLNSFLPQERRKQLHFGGRLRCDSLHLQGNGSKGLKSVTGQLHLQDGSLSREGRLLVNGLSGGIGFSRKYANIQAKGRLSLAGPRDKALLEGLDLPFSLTASPKLQLLSAEILNFSATLGGVTAGGRLAFDASKASPLTASLKAPAAKLSSLNPLLKRFDLQAASGTASATLGVTGKSGQELSATANVQLFDLRGTRGKHSFAAKKGSLTARVQRKGGHLRAQGDARFTSAAVNGNSGNARFAYRIMDDMLYLDRTLVSAAGTELSFSKLSARIPGKAAGTPARYPISIDVAGLAVKQRELEISNLSGRVRGSFNSDSAGRWFEGTADLVSEAANWQGKRLSAPRLSFVFSRSAGRGQLSGQLFGGKLAGTLSFDPSAPKAGATFDLRLTGAGLEAAAQLVPKNAGLYPSGGRFDLHLAGGYSGAGGINCRFDSQGSGIALSGKKGKTLISGAGLTLAGSLAEGDLSISQAVLSAGQGVALRLKGGLAQVLSPKRHGSIIFSVPETTLNALVDPFVNMLPRFIQEATLDGALAADGKFELREGNSLVEGGISLQGGRLEIASQELLIADVNGRLPFSLDLSGKGGGRGPAAMSFSRDNYPRILEKLQKDAGAGQLFTVGQVGLGALELGKLTMRVSAGNGMTQITSLKTSLYEGALLGNGFVTLQEGLVYRGDLLIHDLSMRALCNTLPSLNGFITGRVDGVLSLSGTGRGLKGITGFTDLWAREGSGEKMLVSKEFLQRLSKQKLSGLFFSSDRRYDEAEIKAMLEEGDLTFNTLKIVNTNLFGVRDLSVSIAPTQNRISLEHLLESIREAALRGKATTAGEPAAAPAAPEFKWDE